jgi:hypothetical protein
MRHAKCGVEETLFSAVFGNDVGMWITAWCLDEERR